MERTSAVIDAVDGPSAVASRWFRLAVVYFAVAVILGVWMGAAGNLTLYTVHSHLNLLGWVSAALTGLIYQLCPDAARSRLASVHFWLYNLALPPMMAALSARQFGNTAMEPPVAVSSIAVAAAVVLFAVNILLNARVGTARGGTSL